MPKTKINFRGKNMSLLEAKALLVGLKTNVISADLSEEEKIKYQKIEEGKRKSNEEFERRTGKEGFWNLHNEREYLISELKIRINMNNFYNKMKYCREHGHKEKKNSSYVASGARGTRVHANCSRCGMLYERGLTSKEWDEFDKAMRTPMTI